MRIACLETGAYWGERPCVADWPLERHGRAGDVLRMMQVATQSFFRGAWNMVRIIENVPEGVIGEFWGEARFVPDGQGLACRETGVLRFRGADYHASRVSLWRFPGEGRVEVQYDDGRPFHAFLEDAPRAVHDCGDDRYTVSYEFEPGSWVSRWDVRGPAKDYAMTTRYRRIVAPLQVAGQTA